MNDLIILAALVDGPKHGYQLKREAGFIFGHGDLHNNLIYPLLRRFTDSGWVTKRTVPGQRGQTRQEYAITPLGHKALMDQVRAFTDSDAASQSAFLIRVGMFSLLEANDRSRILEMRESYLHKRQQRLSALSGNMDIGEFGGDTIQLLRDQAELELAWIRDLRQKLAEPTPVEHMQEQGARP
jgi:DNA-binding PadR family transcriptional regulator